MIEDLRIAVSPIRDIEFRDASATPDGSWTVSGYAAVYGEETTLYDGTFMRLREIIAPGAFDRILREKPLVHLNLGHDMNRSVAATDVPAGDIGSLILRSDDIGLQFLAKVDREDPDSVAMAAKLRRGVIKQSSFAFRLDPKGIKDTETQSDDGKVDTLREIRDIKALYDVCCTPRGAYQQTSSGVRSLWGQFADRDQPLLRGLDPEVNGDDPPGQDWDVVRAQAVRASFLFPVQLEGK